MLPLKSCRGVGNFWSGLEISAVFRSLVWQVHFLSRSVGPNGFSSHESLVAQW